MAECIAGIAAEDPTRAALIDERGERTFGELDERVNRAISALRRAGLAADDTVAVLCGNRRELFEVTLAAMHASWVIVPVNWHWVADELEYVLADSGASALVVEGPYLATAVDALDRGDGGVPVRVVIDPDGPVPDGFVELEALLAGGSPDEPDDQATGGPMFYTSGTTGFPKGVRGGLSRTGEPAALWQLVAGSICDLLGLPERGVTLLEGPAYHSAQWAFSMAPLVGRGSTVVMRHRFDAAEMLELIDAHAVTNVHLVPTQMTRLLRLPDEVRAGFDGSSLVTVMHGAAPCPPGVKRAMLEWWGPVVSEYYGGTEGGFLSLATGAQWLAKPGTLGPPTWMAELSIRREDGTEADVDEDGQIWFRSTMGSDFEYHNAPDKTAAAHQGDGWGTLGDVGHLDADGELVLSDRRIDMIISGGVNIYPAEIEGVLLAHPAVADAAVFGIPDEEFGEQVKAAVELVGDHDLGDDAEAVLVAHCREHLAGYKAPRSIDLHEALPRQPTGKLAKRVLRDPYWEGVGRSI